MNNKDNIQTIRAERLKGLRTSKGISTKALADATGISVGSLNAWENDDATAGKTSTDGMKLENLIKLADFYGVSLDYLAGRTDVKSPSPTVQAACEYIGLSDKAAEKIHRLKELKYTNFREKSYLDALNHYVESDRFAFAVGFIAACEQESGA